MSRTQSQGIEYFPMAVDFFSDKKVKILKARYGADGITIYLYLLCQIYREGYYTRVDEDFEYMLSDDLNMSSDKVKQVMTFLFERSMFHEQLFKSDAILTSTGIQERWQKAISTRARKSPIEVGNYWLLNESDTQPFIKCTLFKNFKNNSEKKDDNSAKKALNSENYSQSKVKESIYTPFIPQGGREGEKDRFFSAYPKLKGMARQDDSGIDYAALYQHFQKSEFLRTRFSAKWVIDNYADIIAGVHDDKQSAEEQARERDEWYRERRERAEEIAEYNRRKAEAIDGYTEDLKEMKRLEIAAAKAEASGAVDYSGNMLSELSRLRERLKTRLASVGLAEDDLRPKYHCQKCSDTGFFPNGKPCDCYEKLKGEKGND